jgi:hypothetical protein
VGSRAPRALIGELRQGDPADPGAGRFSLKRDPVRRHTEQPIPNAGVIVAADHVPQEPSISRTSPSARYPAR